MPTSLGLAMLLAAVATPEQATPTATPGVRFAAGDRAVGIPFEIASNKPFVRVRVAGSQDLWFILDTGAYNSALDRAAAAALRLPIEGRDQVGGAGDASVEETRLGAVSFGLPGVELTAQRLVALPLAALDAIEGRAVQGLLGYDFLRQFVVEIDYASRRLSLYDPRTYRYAGHGEVISITLEEGWAFATLALVPPGQPPIHGKFLVDTGVRASLLVSRPFAEQHRLGQSAAQTLEATIGRGIGGETRGTIARLERLGLGGLQLESPIVALSLDQQGFLSSPDHDGILGGEVLRRFRVILDYDHQRMILEPGDGFALPFDYDMSGVFLTAEGPDGGAPTVWRLIAHSPAAQAGLQEGDVIEAIDGEPTSLVALDTIREMLRRPGRHYRLRVRRGTERLELRLTLRRLI